MALLFTTILTLSLTSLTPTLALPQTDPTTMTNTTLTPSNQGYRYECPTEITTKGNPAANDCSNALLQDPLTFTTPEHDLDATRLPIVVQYGRCRVDIDFAENLPKQDRISDLGIQLSGSQLILTCAKVAAQYRKGAIVRTGGSILIGANKRIKVALRKLPEVVAGTVSVDDEEEEEDAAQPDPSPAASRNTAV